MGVLESDPENAYFQTFIETNVTLLMTQLSFKIKIVELLACNLLLLCAHAAEGKGVS